MFKGDHVCSIHMADGHMAVYGQSAVASSPSQDKCALRREAILEGFHSC